MANDHIIHIRTTREFAKRAQRLAEIHRRKIADLMRIALMDFVDAEERRLGISTDDNYLQAAETSTVPTVPNKKKAGKYPPIRKDDQWKK